MRKLFGPVVIAGLFVALKASLAGQARIGQAPLNCDRACLTGLADSYLASLVAHDAKRAALAPNMKFTEQTQVLPLTEGYMAMGFSLPLNSKNGWSEFVR